MKHFMQDVLLMKHGNFQGLLQSETEGVDDEKVGFYGRCPLHAIDPICQSEHDSIDSDVCCREEKSLTCARAQVSSLLSKILVGLILNELGVESFV